jgi:protein-tyrosine phosphatase
MYKYIGMMKQTIKNALREVYWAYQGKGLKNPPLPVSPKSILYVCKGNICRSPFAERLTKKKIEKGSNAFLTIRSAGIDTTVKNPPPKEAIDSAKNFGISMDDHRAQRLTQKLISGSDMIVVMEVKHLKQLEEAFPGSKGRCFLLSMFSHDQRRWGSYYSQYNIADPYGKNKDQFTLCYEIIEMHINNLLLEIGIN